MEEAALARDALMRLRREREKEAIAGMIRDALTGFIMGSPMNPAVAAQMAAEAAAVLRRCAQFPGQGVYVLGRGVEVRVVADRADVGSLELDGWALLAEARA